MKSAVDAFDTGGRFVFSVYAIDSMGCGINPT